ncbi:MAG: hypothetical protein F6J92_30735 [Symploca sp. SIO1A3]|nr:hypothetical protein [Symploca sp. SIO1A3]
MAQPNTEQDFPPLPQYRQSKTSNQTWVNVTTTRTDPDGTTTQRSQIISKRS